jgi:hypothetical protein
MKKPYQLIATAIYILSFFLLFPCYKYVIDTDGISYLHVASFIAKAEYYNSLNSCWSPLSSWLLAPFIKAGFNPILSAKYINGLLGLLTLYSCYSLIEKININETIKKILPFPIVIFLLSCCFHELCADLLVLFLLTLYLNLIFSNNFINNNYKIALAGALGAVCYFAKAYSFPFFLFHFFITLVLLLKKNKPDNFLPTLIKKTAIAFIIFFIIVTPYIIALSVKYGSPQISSAGKLNISWAIADTTGTEKLVIKPPYPNGTSYWDDPFYSQDKFTGAFTSFKYFTREIRWTAFNSFKLLDILNGISIFCITIFISFFIYLLYTGRNSKINEWLLFITAIVYQIGFPFVNIEWRYVWLLVILLLLMAAIVLGFLLEKKFISKRIMIAVTSVISLSFMHQPLDELKKLKNSNKDVFEIADSFNKNNIKGNFLYFNYHDEICYPKTLDICYLTQSSVYGCYKVDYTFDEVMQNAQKYNIDYFLYYYTYAYQKEMFLQSPYAKAGIKVFDNLYPGIIVVQLK